MNVLAATIAMAPRRKKRVVTTSAMSPRPLGSPPHQARPFGLDRLILQESTEITGQLLCRRVPRLGVLSHGHEHDGFKLGRNRRVEPAGRGHLLLGDLAENLLPVVPIEGRSQGQKFVQRGGQRVNVGPVIKVAPLGQHCSGLM